MRTNKWLSDEEIERSKQITRDNPQRTRIHHFVPQMYLKRWADSSGDLRFTEIDTGRSELTAPEAIANDEFFYQIVGEDIDPDNEPDLWFETHMSRIEDVAAKWLRALDNLPDGRVKDPNLADNLAVFVGLQSQRTPRRRAAELDIDAGIERFGARNILNDRRILPIICKANGIPYSPARHNQIVEEILANQPFSSEPKAKAIDTAIKVWRNRVTPRFADERTWWLATSDDPIATCDEPVVLIGKTGQPRDRFPSLDSTPLVLFPIGPHRLLISANQGRQLLRPHTFTFEEAQAVNLEIAANCLENVYEKPGSDIAAHIGVPPQPEFNPSTASTFWEAAMPPTRWASAIATPEWPLRRWTTD
jgi:hypothetical protein